MPATQPHDSVPPAHDDRPVVLYVEDHPVNVVIMTAMLNHRPHLRLVAATTGEEGLEAARIERPDLLLIDFHLPDCNGVELLAQLRDLDGLEAIPAVAVSATDEAARHLPGSSFCEFWPKPLDVHETLESIDRLIDHPPPPPVQPRAAARSFFRSHP